MFRSCLKPACVVLAVAAVQCVGQGSGLNAQTFVEYPNQNRSYGDHTLNSNWEGVNVGLTVAFDSDDVTLHEDGVGSSQRTARNTQNYVGPTGAANPQNYDNDFLVGVYGSRLPLIQQMSSNGSSVLTYAFDSPIDFSVDLFITDVDSSDQVFVTAFDGANALIDMTQWSLISEGDLSTYKDTGADFSDTVAPTPTTVFDADFISMDAVNDTNYNRSYSVVRSPPDIDLSRIEILFNGNRNSPDRDNPNTGSHIYAALSTAALPGDFNDDGVVNIADIDFYSGNLGQPASFNFQLDLDGDDDIDLDDLNFHIENYVQVSNGQAGTPVGDMNLDGLVDVLGDGFILVANLDSAGPYSYGSGDLNADQVVDVLGDGFTLVSNLGRSNSLTANPATVSVPEPSGTLLILATGVVVQWRRQRFAV